VFVNLFILSRIRYNKLVSELLGFRVLVTKVAALNLKIDNRAGGSWTTLPKLTVYVMYGLGFALSHIYNPYLCIPISIKLFRSSACIRS